MGQTQTVKDRVWLWGMRVNALQETGDGTAPAFGTSTMTVTQAIEKTGVRNVIMAGGLPIDRTSLDLMPSAKRIICKWSVHKHVGGKLVLDCEDCVDKLLAAKRLAAADARIETYHIDDFSTGSIEAGVAPEHLAQLQFVNAVQPPQLPLGGTVYTLSLDRPELPALLPYFAYMLVPLWHTDQIDTLPAALDRLSELSGGKPMLLCLYVYDFGNGRQIPRELMQRQLDLAEQLICEERVTGLAICGTCMMDLDWEANHCLYEWLERAGHREI